MKKISFPIPAYYVFSFGYNVNLILYDVDVVDRLIEGEDEFVKNYSICIKDIIWITYPFEYYQPSHRIEVLPDDICFDLYSAHIKIQEHLKSNKATELINLSNSCKAISDLSEKLNKAVAQQTAAQSKLKTIEKITVPSVRELYERQKA